MTLRTVLVWSMAASLFAGCSGGAGNVLTSDPRVDTTNSAVSLQLDTSQVGSSSTTRNGRTPQFIGASVNNVAYSFTPGPIAGTIALSTCAHSGTPVVYTCNIGLPANTYAVTITLENGSTAVGSGSATGIAIAPSTTTPVSIQINPINGGPAYAITGATTQFYVDGHAQTIATALNELDPVGNIITTYYGPVANFPTLTLTDSNGTTGVTLNGGVTTFSTVPTTQSGGIAASIAYNGTSVNATSLALSVSDGTHVSNTVTIPYVSMANNAASSTLSFGGVGAGDNLSVTVTESQSTGGTASLDTSVTSSTTCSPADVSITPNVTGGTNTLTAGAVTYTLTANDTTFSQCQMTVTSVKDPNLNTVVTIKPPAGVNLQPS